LTTSAAPTALLIGDIALLHDTNGLLGLRGRAADLTIVACDCSENVQRDIRQGLNGSPVAATVVSISGARDESTIIQAGLSASRGEIVVLLPSYQQCDLSQLQQMIDAAGSEYDYLASRRDARTDSKWNQLKSSVFNRIVRSFTGIPLHDLNSGLRVLRREVAERVPIYGDLHRFWPVLAAAQGYRIAEMSVKHVEERVRKGDYRLGVYLRRIIDLLTLFFLIRFTRKPLRFFGLLGSGSFAIGAALTAVLCVQRAWGQPLADRPALIFGVLFVVLGIQLFSFGLVGELIIFAHGNTLRDYHIKRVYEAAREPLSGPA
jgi:hypothetical protein